MKAEYRTMQGKRVISKEIKKLTDLKAEFEQQGTDSLRCSNLTRG